MDRFLCEGSVKVRMDSTYVLQMELGTPANLSLLGLHVTCLIHICTNVSYHIFRCIREQIA